MRSLIKNRKGLTGIETAIIVIAFVIAASVFAFAVLNMGLLTTSKAQEAIVSGVGQAQSSMKITSVYAYADGTGSNAKVKGLALLVQISGTQSVDFTASKIAISYKNDDISIADVYTSDHFINTTEFADISNYNGDLRNLVNTTVNPNGCTIVEVQGDEDNLLEAGEIFAVFLNLQNINSELAPLGVYKTFTTELIPGHGSKLTFTGQMPASLLPVMVLSGA
ncbi:MAG: archaellin/type IV pilin N-terminal domain-containing protein [Candidatus Methanomethylicaceae archaeon]